ncbi:MAG: hypothetical protein AAGH92_05235 [Planctomycetota bacterium]
MHRFALGRKSSAGRLAAIVLAVSALPVTAEDLSVYFVGNSLTDAVRAGDLDAIAGTAGHGLDWGQHLIWGSSLNWLWENPDQASKVSGPYGMWSEALPSNAWDAVSLQPFDRKLDSEINGEPAGDVVHALNFIDLTLQAPVNRDTRFLIYQHSPAKPNDGSEVSYEDWWVNRAYEPGWNQTHDISEYAYLLRDALEAELDARPADERPNRPIEVVPVGDVFLGLDTLMRGGGLDGAPAGSEVWDLYTDHVHFNATGQYAAAMTYYAVLFGESPEGLPTGNYLISQERAAQVQSVVWTVVNGGRIEPGDANLDGRIDQADLNALLSNWGATDAAWATGDFDGDRTVNQADLNAVLANWGKGSASVAEGVTLPEPTSGVATAALLMLGRRVWR